MCFLICLWGLSQAKKRKTSHISANLGEKKNMCTPTNRIKLIKPSQSPALLPTQPRVETCLWLNQTSPEFVWGKLPSRQHSEQPAPSLPLKEARMASGRVNVGGKEKKKQALEAMHSPPSGTDVCSSVGSSQMIINHIWAKSDASSDQSNTLTKLFKKNKLKFSSFLWIICV